MRILIFLPCFTYGGAEKQGKILAYHLLELGHEVEAWAFPAPKANTPFRVEMTDKGVVCHEFPAWPQLDWHGISEESILACHKFDGIRWKRQLDKLASQIPHSQFDIVIPFTFWPSLISALFRDSLGASVVVWNHRGGFDDAEIEYSPFIVEKIREAAPVFVANSSAGSLFLQKKFGLDPTAVHVISNTFIPESNLLYKRKRPSHPEHGECQLVQIANFFPEKDFDTLLYAMRLLKESNVPCHLHLAGSFPGVDQEFYFFQKLNGMGLSGSVTHHGRLDQAGVRILLERADIGILSSKSEGCPNSVMEYMYWGLPVVGTDIPGIRDLVGEISAPYLFRVGDVFQLKAQIEFLAKDSGLRTKLGKANQHRLTEMFSPQTIFPLWFDVLLSKSSGYLADGRSGQLPVRTEKFGQAARAGDLVPLVSVIIPCFNQEKYLAESLESVFSQTYPCIEIIVIDDGSTDATASIAKSYIGRIRFVQQTNRGASAARNAGLAICVGKYIQYLDGDDIIETNKIEKQVTFLETHPKVGIIYSDVRYFTDEQPDARAMEPDVLEPGRPWVSALWERPGSIIEKIIDRNILAINCALVRQSAVTSVGQWNEQLSAVEDWEYWVRCADAGVRFEYAAWANTLSLVRLHSGSTSTQIDCVNLGQYQMCLHLARTLRDSYAIEVNWRRGIWWAARLETKGRLRRFWDLFCASPRLATKLHIFEAFVFGRYWTDHPSRRFFRRVTVPLKVIWRTCRKLF